MTKVMKTLSVLGLTAALAGGVVAFNSAPAAAGGNGKFVTGLIIGGAVGAIANEAARDHQRRYDPPPRSHRNASWRTNKHINWCYRHYPNSYDEYDNTWVSHGGRVRTCRSPYWG